MRPDEELRLECFKEVNKAMIGMPISSRIDAADKLYKYVKEGKTDGSE